MTTTEPCTAGEAVDRALRLLHRAQYQLGAGDFFADERAQPAFDCCGLAISYCWKLPRHEPGYNTHTPPQHCSCVDDIDVDSFYEDAAYGLQQYGVVMPAHEPPRPGDLFITRSIRKGDVEHAPDFEEMGHVRICVKGPTGWDPLHPLYVGCTMVEIHGPNGTPGPIMCSGQSLDNWNAKWPTPKFCVVVVRPHERV